jgi:hypothetical protein
LWSTSSSWNSTFDSIIKFDSNSQANARLVGFTQPIHKSNGQFLLIKINLSKISICRQHLWSAVKIPTMENTCFVSIWLVGMSKICHAGRKIIWNLYSSLHHQDNTNYNFLHQQKIVKIQQAPCTLSLYVSIVDVVV